MFNIWPFKRREASGKELVGQQLETDYHAHWLPGVDDGSKDMETTLSMIAAFAALGYQKLVATPHIMADLYPNQPHDIRSSLNEVRAAAKSSGLNIQLEAAAEYMLDEGFYQHLESGEILCIKDNLVLVEQSMLQPMPGIDEKIFAMQIKGYQPVLAHPERYGFMFTKRLDHYKKYKDMGCLFQLNILSLTGYYGKPVAQTANQLIRAGYYDLAGSDAHHLKHLDKLSDWNINLRNLAI